MTEVTTVQLVIRYLGRIAIVLVAGVILLSYRLITKVGGDPIDPVAVAVVGAVSTLASGVLGALGALLVSTRTTGPVPVEGAPGGEPVGVVEK